MSTLNLHSLPSPSRRIPSRQRLYLFFGLMVSIALTPVGLISAPPPWAAELTDRIVAIVNKEIITMSEVDAEMVDERKRLRALYSGEELERRLNHKAYDVLNALIERKVQLQEAEAKGITVNDEEVKRAVQQLSMEQMGTPFAGTKLKKEVREQMTLERLWNFEVRQKVMVTDSEIAQYYEDHTEEFLVAPSYRLRQILFLVGPGDNERQKQSRADSVYLALKTNGNFGALALKYSDGPEGSEGGSLGEVREDELLTPIAQALKTMKPGDISPPIKTKLGYHIIQLDEVTPSKARDLAEVENQIKSRLYKQQSDKAFRVWLRELKKKAFIEIKF